MTDVDCEQALIHSWHTFVIFSPESSSSIIQGQLQYRLSVYPLFEA